MATNKTNYLKLNDWVGTDAFRREELNENFRKLDGKAKEHDDAIADNAALLAEKVQYPIYVNIQNEVINMIAKYNKIEDIRIKMNKKGVNNIFDFSFMFKVPNSTEKVSNDISGLTAFNTNSSDWFSPYKVAAVANIDGDDTLNEYFTGGNHGYDNTGNISGNSPTGRTSSLKFVVDGREVTEFDGYCNFVDIYWSNRVQAYNTRKADGTGREILQENYHLHYDGHKFEIRNTIEFLESATWKSYYGLEVQRTAWKEKLLYRSSANRKWNDGSLSSNSTDKNCNIVTLYNGTDYLDVSVDENIGLGRKTLLTTSSYNSFSSTSKTYFWLVDGSQTVEAGDIFTLEGYYRFYSI